MPYVYLILSVFCMASASVLGGYYNRRTAKYKGATSLFNFIRMLATLVCWCVFFVFDCSFNLDVLLYSLFFGLSFAVCVICTLHALKHGSVALTSLFMQASLIGVTIWGIIFWNAKFTPLVCIGLVLVTIGIALCILDKKTGENNSKGISLKWLIFATLMFLTNAVCSIMQREQQIRYSGQHGSLLMVGVTAIATAVCFVIWKKDETTDFKVILKKDWVWPVFAGVGNFLLNVFVILLATSYLSSSLIYPVLSVCGLFVTTMFSLFAFKEKLKWWQWVGFVIGTVAIALLNL